MGGCKGGWRDMVPLSRDLHDLQHAIGIKAFEDRFEVSLHALRHVLVVSDPGVDVSEQVAAWRRLHEHPAGEVTSALQRGLDLTGFPISPPRVAEESTF
jgi:hypothetical protein